MSAESPFQAPGTDELSELLPAYDVTTFIAQGGMGAVYRASQRSLDRDVAIKILPREFGRDEDFRKRFEAEAKAMAKLNHPNLVGVYDFGEVDGMPYIVMEYVNGKSLHHSAHGKAIDQKTAGQLALGICEGLAHAHDADIIHRDIKPANILLDPKANPKIGDFGLASTTEAGKGDTMVFGTPGYTAPEVIKDPSSVGKRSDIFSTGVILYELLTGELPGDSYVPASQKQKVDPRFDRIIRRATHPSPTLRYADGEAMAVELRTLLAALKKPAAAAGLVSAAPSSGASARLQTADSGKPSDATAPVPTVAAHPGPNWSLLRNLVIIAVLLASIFGVWKMIEAKQARIARDQEEHRLAEQERLKAEAARREAERLAARREADNGGTGSKPPVPVPLPPREETPLEQLERLQDALARADRSEFPKGTERRATSAYFFVDRPMSWQEAALFAEEHGGHLATCPSDSDSNWLSARIPDNQAVWLGGGAIGRSNWGWVDGSEWTHREPNTSTGTCAVLTALGTVKAASPEESLPFFIQWHMDGSNPGSLGDQLARTRESLANANPVYPPGTFTLDSRRYLLVARPMDWDDAHSLAQSAGGHLAVPSEGIEADYLQQLVTSALDGRGATWIGGRYDGRSWKWTTGEPWNEAHWAPGSPGSNQEDDSALRLVGGGQGGWDDADPEDEDAVHGLLIEWSKDSETKREASLPLANTELAKLRTIATNAVQARTADYRKDMKAVGKSFKWDLDFWHRGMANGPKEMLRPGVVAMKDSVRDDGSIPRNIPRTNMPAEAQKILNGYLDKQNRTHQAFLVELERLRVGYLNKLAEIRTDLESRGLKAQVQSIDNEVNACGLTAEDFFEHFTGENLPEPDRDA